MTNLNEIRCNENNRMSHNRGMGVLKAESSIHWLVAFASGPSYWWLRYGRRRPRRFATLNEGVLSMMIRKKEINQDSILRADTPCFNAGDKSSVASNFIPILINSNSCVQLSPSTITTMFVTSSLVVQINSNKPF